MNRKAFILLALAMAPLASYAGPGTVTYCPFPGSEDKISLDKAFDTTGTIGKGQWFPLEAGFVTANTIYNGTKRVEFGILDMQADRPSRARLRYQCWNGNNQQFLNKNFKGGRLKDDLEAGGEEYFGYRLKTKLKNQQVPAGSFCQTDVKFIGNDLGPGKFFTRFRY